MATINNATRLGVPNLADTGDIDQDTLGVESQTANALTNRYTDFDAVNTTQIDSAGLILNNSLTSQSIQYFLNRLIVGAGILVGTEVVTQQMMYLTSYTLRVGTQMLAHSVALGISLMVE